MAPRSRPASRSRCAASPSTAAPASRASRSRPTAARPGADAKLGQDLGKYSFREWTLPVTLAAGPHVLMARATSNGGKTQPLDPLWNPAGYMRNVVEKTRVTAVA